MKYTVVILILVFLSGCSLKNHFLQEQKKINYVKVIKEESYITIPMFGFPFRMKKSFFIKSLRHGGIRGCRRAFAVDKLIDNDMEQIKYHSYSVVDSRKKLKRLKNTITYILFPRNLAGKSKNSQKYQRYSKVLELIQELKEVRDNNSSNSSIDKYENKFILLKNNSKVTVENYNYVLGNQLIDFFKEKLPPSFFDDEGPFFITTTSNVFELEKDFNFIHLNLTKFNNSAINQLIDNYKDRLVDKGDTDLNILETWYYKVLSGITNFNNELHLIQVTFQDVKKSEGS